MASYDRNFTDELRTRLSIVDVVSRRVPLTKKGLNFWGCCPFHNEKTPSFSVNEEKGFYHCFGCGEHGDIISFTMKTNNMDFRAAIAELANQAGLKLPDYKPKTPEQQERENSYFTISERAAELYQARLFTDAGAAALAYIRGRGFTDDIIKKYRIGYAPKNNLIANSMSGVKESALLSTGLCRRGEYGLYDFFRDKLMFPIFNPRGQVIAFSGRSLDGSEPKYINTSDTDMLHKRQTIFGLNFARDAIHRANRSIVVEGQIDAIRMQTNGFPETVAPLGTALTEEHLAILCKSNRNIVFCFDGDAAGQQAAARACSLVMPFLRDNADIKFAFVTGGKDPDEVLKSAGADAMRKIIDGATGLVDFLWTLTNEKFLTTTPAGRSQAEKFLGAELNKIQDATLKREIDREYQSRKFNQWHKWSRKADANAADIALPGVDQITHRTLIAITDRFPELAERYAEFLATLNLDFEGNAIEIDMTAAAAERFIVSIKLNKYLDKLNADKKAALADVLAGKPGADEVLRDINAKILDAMNKRNTVLSVVD